MEEQLLKKDERRINRASLRSRKRIITALLDLMEERSFTEITIREIADKAELVRRTFYGHFSSKEEVLRTYIDDLCFELSQEILDAGDSMLLHVSEQFFAFWNEHMGFLRMLKKSGLFIPIDTVERLLKKLEMTLHIERWKYIPHRELSFSYAYMAGGLLNLLNSWVDRESGESSQEMAKTFVCLIGDEK